MKIAFVRRTQVPLDYAALRPFVRRLGAYLDVPDGDLTVLFCDDVEIAEINAAWRGKKGPTDVLSFGGGGATAEGRIHVGDLAISAETASRAARRAQRTLSDEVETLLAHGILHLLGFDHETDDGTMMRLQARVLSGVRGSVGGGRTPGAAASDRSAGKRSGTAAPARSGRTKISQCR